jgi:phage gp37-like protein
MNKMIKIGSAIAALMLLANCAGTYSVKHDGVSNSKVVEAVPAWYVEYKGIDGKFYQETGQSVSPDMELAVKKAVILAKAKLADRLNGELNNKTIIAKTESGTDENQTVKAGASDTVVNMISNIALQHYEVSKKELYATGEKSYRSYVMIRISKEEVDKAISDIKSRQSNSGIDTKELEKKSQELLDKKS